MATNNAIHHVGTPPPEHEAWEVFTFHVHDFERVVATASRDERIDLPSFSCFGHRWMLVLYPGGNAVARDGWMSVFLHNESDEGAGEAAVNFAISARDAFGGVVDGSSSSLAGTFRTDTEFTDSWGVDDCLEREAVLRPTACALRNGTLTLDLSMQLAAAKTGWKYPVHAPRNPVARNVLRLYLDEESADVTFEAGGRLFPAHRAILKFCAPTLAELCESCAKHGDPVPVSDDVDPDVFRRLLFYVYGGRIPSSEFEDGRARDYIEAADKYDVVNLKMEAEVEYVKRTALTAESAVDELLYADAMHLALLKETALDFIRENAREVLASASFKDSSQGILSDLLSLEAMRNGEDNCAVRQEQEHATKYQSTSVNELRWELSKRGMDVDGSRNMLVKRLERESDEEETDDSGRKRKTMDNFERRDGPTQAI